MGADFDRAEVASAEHAFGHAAQRRLPVASHQAEDIAQHNQRILPVRVERDLLIVRAVPLVRIVRFARLVRFVFARAGFGVGSGRAGSSTVSALTGSMSSTRSVCPRSVPMMP